MVNFTRNVADSNPSDCNVQAKAALYFMKGNKADLALKTVRRLVVEGPHYPKTQRVVETFTEFAKTASFSN